MKKIYLSSLFLFCFCFIKAQCGPREEMLKHSDLKGVILYYREYTAFVNYYITQDSFSIYEAVIDKVTDETTCKTYRGEKENGTWTHDLPGPIYLYIGESYFSYMNLPNIKNKNTLPIEVPISDIPTYLICKTFHIGSEIRNGKVSPQFAGFIKQTE
jgi:hypothetical protein